MRLTIPNLLNVIKTLTENEIATKENLKAQLRELQKQGGNAVRKHKFIFPETIRTIVYDIYGALIPKQQLLNPATINHSWIVELVRYMTSESYTRKFYGNPDQDLIFTRLKEISDIILAMGVMAHNKLLPSPDINGESYSFLLVLIKQFQGLLNKTANESYRGNEGEKIFIAFKNLHNGLLLLLQNNYFNESDFLAIRNEINRLNGTVGVFGEFASQIESIRSQIFSILNPTPVRTAPVETVPAPRSANVTMGMPVYYVMQLQPLNPMIYFLWNQMQMQQQQVIQPTTHSAVQQPSDIQERTTTATPARTPTPTFRYSHNPYGNSLENAYVNHDAQTTNMNEINAFVSTHLRRSN